MDTNTLKLPIYVTVLLFLAVGLLTKSPQTAHMGAILFAVSTLISLWGAYVSSKKSKENPKLSIKASSKTHSSLDNLVALFEIGIVFMSLFLLVSSDFSTAGSIIWFSALISYVLWGIVISLITGIPLRFGYGGWTAERKRTSKRH